MVDALTQVGPTSKDFTKQFRMFHVRETIERAASLVIPGHMLMSSIDEHLQVTAQEGFFVMIICDLLRNAWRFSSEVAVSAAPRRAAGGEQWLDICIESRGECRPQLTDYDDRGILAALNLDSYAELRGSKSLARSYRLPDGRSGSVTENRYHANYRCTFQLPLAAECPLPSDC
jgi:hypothetical protein